MRTPFAGEVVRWLATAGERVQPGQPSWSGCGFPATTHDRDLGGGSVPGADGRVVLVTGGNRGIGRACVEWFVANGDRVAATYRGDAPPGPAGAADRYLAVRCDVTDGDDVDRAFTEIEARFGPVEVVVANAGVTRDTLVLRMDEAAWAEVIDTNLTGAYRVAKRALAKMLRLHRGRIVFVSSVGAFVGLPGQANYAASKAGLVGSPGPSPARWPAAASPSTSSRPGSSTPTCSRPSATSGSTQLGALVPLGRARRRPTEVAERSASWPRPAPAYVTGAVLPVDGGLAMGL